MGATADREWVFAERRPTRALAVALAVVAAVASVWLAATVGDDDSSDRTDGSALSAAEGSAESGDGESTIRTTALGAAGGCEPDASVAGGGFNWSCVGDLDGELGGPGDQEMRSVAVGGPGLVAVGSAGSEAAVWTSEDGWSWSRVEASGDVFGDRLMNSVIAGGPGLVAVGSGPQGAAVWTSVDGLDWSLVEDELGVFGSDGSSYMSTVVAAGPGLVAAGSDRSGGMGTGAVWTSAEGLEWSRLAGDTDMFGGDGHHEVLSLTVGGPGLVAVGYQHPVESNRHRAAVWTSVDGLSWSRVPHDRSAFGGWDEREMHSITSGGSGLVAVGVNGPGNTARAAVWTSEDGRGWSPVTAEGMTGAPLGQMMSQVISSPAGLVAVGGPSWDAEGPAVVWISRDGADWSPVPHSHGVFGRSGALVIHSIAETSFGLVAVGTDYSLLGETDAAVWIATYSGAAP